MQHSSSALSFAFLFLGLALTLGGAEFASAQDAKQASSLVPAARTDAGSIARETELIRRAKESGPVHVIFVGDSITQGWEGGGKDAWTQCIAPFGSLNLGNSGDRTENVLWRLDQAPLTRLEPTHVVLLIGTNNLGHGTSTAQETLDGMKAVATKLAEQCPKATIHILEVFPRGEKINPMRGELCQINQALRAFVRDDAAKHGGTSRYKINALGDAFLSADGSISKELMPDSLHLTPKAYTMWAEEMVRQIPK